VFIVSLLYELEITSAKLAEEMDISVEEVEALTEEEMEAYMNILIEGSSFR
jgi:plasmid maintenance system antidote protein VapI